MSIVSPRLDSLQFPSNRNPPNKQEMNSPEKEVHSGADVEKLKDD